MRSRINTGSAVLALITLSGIVLACSVSFGSQDPTEDIALDAGQAADALPQDDSPEMPADVQPGVSYNGVSLTTDFGETVSSQTIPSDMESDPYWGMPEHDEFTIKGYPVQNDYHTPTIYIFPVETYRTENEVAGEVIDELGALLAARPADPGSSIPFLPVFNAGQMGIAKVQYLDFQSGSGIRFMTQFGQAFWPINNSALVYTYQGLTDDSRYYVSVVMPLSHPALGQYDDYQPPEDFYDIADQLIRDQIAMLNAEQNGSFAPSIDDLDALVRSLKVEK